MRDRGQGGAVVGDGRVAGGVPGEAEAVVVDPQVVLHGELVLHREVGAGQGGPSARIGRAGVVGGS
ncbi:hypothetical protein NUM3379_08370 [Kineococcus sp. NUM-3379]